ncbi:hypothetical protein QW060_21370 [Myroides ceti]|uniref:Uncharacterized protein n=1 Tax=Paenimyroides ceti TaxID=395087 RepID=A0ABT8CYA0_9FLAO|nr:hypothetical protein [Paenimyroides ceti]MDN3706147.1 hypothetical protein [Paenimyroides ceti]MDN3709528.1 hypothetical protein [Paenimyroides ceti]
MNHSAYPGILSAAAVLYTIAVQQSLTVHSFYGIDHWQLFFFGLFHYQ